MSNSPQFNVEKFKRRVDRAGGSFVSAHDMEMVDTVAIDFKLVITEEKETLGSIIELDDKGDVELAVIRYPAIDVSGDQGRETLNEVKTTLVDAVSQTVYLTYQFGVIQTPHIQLNMKGPHGGDTVVPHLEFRRAEDGTAKVDRDEIIMVLSDTKEAWETELFAVETKARGIYDTGA